MKENCHRGLKLVVLAVGMILLPILFGVFFGGCTLPTDYTYSAVPEFGFQSVSELMFWVSRNIEWEGESKDYWKSPEQTYLDGCGDCEDISILTMYLLHQEFGFLPMLVIGPALNYSCHAWVYVDGHYWEPQAPGYVDNDPTYKPKKHISYERALYRGTVTHRSLEEE